MENDISKHRHVIVPGKLILSGEHSVLYNGLAISFTINRYMNIELTKIDNSSELKVTTCSEFNPEQSVEQNSEQNVKLINNNIYSLTEVNKSTDLLLYSFSHWLNNLSIEHFGFELKINSTIPQKSGMGSSSALILGLGIALDSLFNKNTDKEILLSYAKKIEDFQHGKSSGLDLRTIMQGGIYTSITKDNENLNLEGLSNKLSLVYTGKSISSTSDCVSSVKHYFDDSLIKEFTALYNNFINSIKNKDFNKIGELIALNHELLVKIAVVPQKIQKFVKELMSYGNFAKICGAGSIAGDSSGMMLVWGSNNLIETCSKYSFKTWPLNIETKGACIV